MLRWLCEDADDDHKGQRKRQSEARHDKLLWREDRVLLGSLLSRYREQAGNLRRLRTDRIASRTVERDAQRLDVGPDHDRSLDDPDVLAPWTLRTLSALERDGLSFAEIVEGGLGARRIVEEYSLPSPARMKPKPLSLTSRLIVPFIGAMETP